MKLNWAGLVTISQRIQNKRYGLSRMSNISPFLRFWCCTALLACSSPAPPASTLLISNAVIHDGSGTDPVRGSVRIDTDRIVAIGDLAPFAGETVVDAGGRVLAPGFIDSHSHHDEFMDKYRHMPGVLSQGVTTIVRGLDGFADDSDHRIELPLSLFNTNFEQRPAAVNIASYAPHNTIRLQVMGNDHKREATDAEIIAMTELVAADMEAGALGLATGLEYVPGIYSSTEEIVDLARVVATFGGRYASHLRDEDDRQQEAIAEILRVGDDARLPIHISHIKIADRASWGRSAALLRSLDDARAAGITVTADIYPYQRWASDLSILFPDRDYSNVAAAEFTFEHTSLPEDIILTDFPSNPEFAGLSILEIARVLEKDPRFVLLELAQTADDYFEETGRSGSGIVAKGMDAGDVAALMQWEFSSICSDGNHDRGHPRGYGAFPRVLGHYVRDLKVLTLPQAIHKMTALPAATLGLKDRGRIQVGYFADMVLFDPEVIEDRATMQDSTALSVGVIAVWVNGVLAFEGGAPTMQYPGRLVKRDVNE